jgi:hypothetical protein
VCPTLLEACDADYRTVVIADCCADTDLEPHRVLIERLFPLRGEVMTAAEVAKAVEGTGIGTAGEVRGHSRAGAVAIMTADTRDFP